MAVFGEQYAKCEELPRRTPENWTHAFRGGEVGDVPVGQNQEYMRLKLQNWGFRDLSLRQHLGSINSEMGVKEKSIHWHYLYIIHEEIEIIYSG